MYIHIYIYVCICIYIYIHNMYIYIYIYVCAYCLFGVFLHSGAASTGEASAMPSGDTSDLEAYKVKGPKRGRVYLGFRV